MVEILGKTFLEHTLDNITGFDISKIIIVTGYFGDEIKEKIGDKYNNIPVKYIENVDYATTNNIYSLYLTHEYLVQDDTILIESDLIFEKKILERLIKSPSKNLAVVAKYESFMDGTVIKFDSENHITDFISKNEYKEDELDLYYKTVNIYKFSKEYLKDEYVPFLSAYISAMGKNSYYETVLKVMLTMGKKNLDVLILKDEKWYEVDNLEDYNRAEKMFG